jgi:prephenate dehydrogenase
MTNENIRKSISILGGSGGMGRVFSTFFKNHGFSVTIHDQNPKKMEKVAREIGVNFDTSLERSVKNADIILVSVPISTTIDVIKSISPYLKKDALICDITSIKHDVCQLYEEILKEKPINCLSLHPMFGPGIKNMRNYIMIVIKVGGTVIYNDLVSDIVRLFKSVGLKIIETTPDVHDKKIASTLGLPHMINILFLNLLKRTGDPLNELTRFTGTTFLLQKVFAESIIQREMEMFGEIQMENSKFLEILNNLELLIKDYKAIIENKDKIKFCELFTQALEYSRNDIHFANSYEYFYKFMKILKKKE